MSNNDAILSIIVGGIGIVAGLTIKQFNAARGMPGGSLSDKPIARWQGQLLFVGIGIVFLSFGIAHFFSDH
jgi:VIT1/CCC1 family predicted Fe2+/Mn2+ transporter